MANELPRYHVCCLSLCVGVEFPPCGHQRTGHGTAAGRPLYPNARLFLRGWLDSILAEQVAVASLVPMQGTVVVSRPTRSIIRWRNMLPPCLVLHFRGMGEVMVD